MSRGGQRPGAHRWRTTGWKPALRDAKRQLDIEEEQEAEIPECTDCGEPIGWEAFGMCARCRAVDAWEANQPWN